MPIGDYIETHYVAGSAPGISDVTLNNNEKKTAELDYAMAKEIRGNLELINLVRNGNFAIDTNGDGLADFWSSAFGTTALSIANNIQKFTPTAQFGSIGQDLAAWAAGDKIFARCSIKSASGNVVLYINDGVNQSGAIYPGDNILRTMSVIRTIAANPTVALVKVQDNKTSGWTPIEVSNFITINLTQRYGAGNEPSLETMNSLIDTYFDGWFDGARKSGLKGAFEKFKGDSNDDISQIASLFIPTDTRSLTPTAWDSANRATALQIKDGTTVLGTITITYNSIGKITQLILKALGKTITYTQTFDPTTGKFTGRTKAVS